MTGLPWKDVLEKVRPCPDGLGSVLPCCDDLGWGHCGPSRGSGGLPCRGERKVP